MSVILLTAVLSSLTVFVRFVIFVVCVPTVEVRLLRVFTVVWMPSTVSLSSLSALASALPPREFWRFAILLLISAMSPMYTFVAAPFTVR